MKRRYIISLLFFLLTVLSGYSQQVDIVVYKTSLNEILIGLRDKYKLQFSFNDQLLSQYNLSIHRKFASPEDAVRSLIKGLPLIYHKQGDIFLILPENKGVAPRNYQMSGQISEAKSNEPLPFSNLLVDNRVIVTDLKGSFTYQGSGDSLFHVKVSHLGYYPLDTVLVAGINHRINLIPSIIGLREIVIVDKSPDRSTQIGNRAGAASTAVVVARG